MPAKAVAAQKTYRIYLRQPSAIGDNWIQVKANTLDGLKTQIRRGNNLLGVEGDEVYIPDNNVAYIIVKK